MAGKFEVYEDRAGKWRFRLKAGNGETVASGEAYETKAAAKKGCESVQKAAEGAQVFCLGPSIDALTRTVLDTLDATDVAFEHVDPPLEVQIARAVMRTYDVQERSERRPDRGEPCL